MKLSKREKILLFVLLWTLLLAVFFKGISYLDSRVDELNESLLVTTSEALSIESKLGELDDLESSYPALQKLTADLAGEFYSVKLNRELDFIVTERAVSCGLTIDSLTITPSTPSVLLQYGMGEQNLTEDQEAAEGQTTEADLAGDIYVGSLSLSALGSLEEIYSFLDGTANDLASRIVALTIAKTDDGYLLTATVDIFMTGIGEANIYEEANS